MINIGARFSRSFILVLCAALSGCGGSGDPVDGQSTQNSPSAGYTYQIPVAKTDGWKVATASDLGLKPDRLVSLLDNINSDAMGFRRMDGILLVKDNQLIFEQQLRTELDVSDGWINNRDLELHAVHSVTKSIMSAAMGIAIEQGLVAGENALVLDYFPQYLPLANDSTTKQSMTISDWLSMQHGLQWNEWDVNYLSPANQNKQMLDSANPMRFLLDLPYGSEPGTVFAYSTGVSYALGQIIAQASGQRFYEYVISHLFEPMGITNYDSWYLGNDAHAGSSLYLTMRSMAKFGQLYLDNGVWQGQQIVPSHWIQNSIQQKASATNIRYGYQWWLNTYTVQQTQYETYSANGWGGQLIIVVPDMNSVIVLTGHRYEDGDAAETNIRNMLENYILPFLDGL